MTTIPLGQGIRRNDDLLFSNLLLKSLCLFFFLSFSLAVAAQDEKTLVLTNDNTQPIWLDTVRYGGDEFPAGYLPPGGRIYIRLGTQEMRTLLLRWHKIRDGGQQQQTLNIDPAFNTEEKRARYFIFAYEGESFIQIHGD